MKISFIQMEYCERSTLRQAIDEQELYKDRGRVWCYFRGIVEGLRYIHDQVLSSVFLLLSCTTSQSICQFLPCVFCHIFFHNRIHVSTFFILHFQLLHICNWKAICGAGNNDRFC